jgi:hypothetical protein
MPEVLLQITHAHLDRRNAMGDQQIEKFTSGKTEQRRRLALRKAAFLEPAQYGGVPQFLWELFRTEAEYLDGFLRELNGDVPSHNKNVAWFPGRSNE